VTTGTPIVESVQAVQDKGLDIVVHTLLVQLQGRHYF